MLTANDYMTMQSETVKAANAFAAKGIEGAQKLAELNMKAMKASLESSAEQMKALMAVKDVKDLNETLVSLAQPRSEAFSQYAKDAYEITSATNAEVTKLIEQQVDEGHKQMSALIENMAKSAPAGSEGAIGLMKQALTASRSAYEQFSKAGKQMVEMTETGFANASKAAASASAAAAKKK